VSALIGSYVCAVLLAKQPPAQRVEAIRRRWRRLTGSVRDPYRPEQHYMRGPGPRWQQKHAHEASKA